MLSFLSTVFIGSGVGAVFSFFGRCNGACAPTSTWRRGALVGAVVGCLLYVVSGQIGSTSMNESTRDVKRIGETQFDAEVIRADLPVVVDFYATWCGPCRSLAPRMDKVAEQFSGTIKFVKVNVDEAQGLAQRFQIQAIPTLLFFKNGNMADRLIGMPSEETLNSRLGSLVTSSAGQTQSK